MLVIGMVFAIAMIINPEFFWAWNDVLTVKKGEPKEVAIFLIGVVMYYLL